jgi:hypothetical protein
MSRSFSCAKSCRAALIKATAFKSRVWPVCRGKFSIAPRDILPHLEKPDGAAPQEKAKRTRTSKGMPQSEKPQLDLL